MYIEHMCDMIRGPYIAKLSISTSGVYSRMMCVLRKNDWLAGEDGKRGLLLCATLYTTDTAGQEYMAPSGTVCIA